MVRAVGAGGTLLDTFEQNLNDIQIEMRGAINLRELTGGRIWVYRAK